MKIKNTIRAKLVFLTKRKRELLEDEYLNLQRFLQGEKDVELYSANKQQAHRFYKKIHPDKEYPLSILKDLLKIERRPTKFAQYWARIPVKDRRGGVWVAIKPHCPITPDLKLCESTLFKRKGDFYLHITVQTDVDVPEPQLTDKTVVIACDISEATPITSVELWNRGTLRKNVQFLGKELRGIRAHYNRLKKRVGTKKVKHAVKWIKKHLKHKETRTVNDVLHKATTQLVDQAKQLRNLGYAPIIVYGDLNGVRTPRIKGKRRCRKNNRKVHTMPSYKVKHMIDYKALWQEIPVIGLNEAYTSQLCWRCGSLDTELNKRTFRCKTCGLEYNRDVNGAVNIGNRLLTYMLKCRAVPAVCDCVTTGSEPAQTLPSVQSSERRPMSSSSMCEGGSPLL